MSSPARPPGPPPRGLIGNFPLGSKDPLALYTEWAGRYGDIFHYRFLNRHIYFLNQPDLVRQVLQNEARNFVKGVALRNNRRIFGEGLLTSEGDTWFRQRRLMQPAFNHQHIVAYAEAMPRHAERMIARWQDGESRDIYAEMMGVTLDIVSAELFRLEFSPERQQFSECVSTLLELSSGGRILLPPVFRMLPTPDNLRYNRAVRTLDRIVYRLIRQRRAELAAVGAPDPATTQDLFSTLLLARDDSGKPMSDSQVRDEMLTLLLAGHETTAIALSWTWYLLARHPDVEQSLWSELTDVLRGRTPTAADLPRLSYTDRVIRESMRLYPPIWAMVRSNIAACELGGYTLPPGSTVLMSQWVMHRDARFFPDPTRFDPNRWVSEPQNGAAPASLPKFAYFPFGGGPRICIGAAFATMEAALILATVAQQYQVRVKPGFIAQPLPTITLRPRTGIPATLVRRSA